MGFSVSGSALVVFIGVFIAVGTAYTVAANTGERLSEARQDRFEHHRAILGTGLNITSVELLDGVPCGVSVSVNNTGSERLSLADTDLLLDNEYRVGWQDNATVDGTAGTDLWLPGEQVTYTNDDISAAPDRVKVVSGSGVADATEVALSC